MLRRTEEGRLHVADETDLTQVVMTADRLAEGVGFDTLTRAKLMTAVSELARNILKYAGRGTVLFVRVEIAMRRGVEIVVEDRGPGIADVERALEDHYSTSGTLGLGLPGVRRMVDEFEIQSARNQGTCVTIRKWLS
jgi:serine/threonine-protein kinase RsbT